MKSFALLSIRILAFSICLISQHISGQSAIRFPDAGTLEKLGVYVMQDKISICFPDSRDSLFLLITAKQNEFTSTNEAGYPVFRSTFYPYYITADDSISGVGINRDAENQFKNDPMFRYIMMKEHLVPIGIRHKLTKTGLEDTLLLWNTPTKEFCEIMQLEYRTEFTDKIDIKSGSIELSDYELVTLGIQVSEKEISLRTYVPIIPGINNKDKIVEWKNNQTSCGTSLVTGDLEKELKKSSGKSKGNLQSSGYFIVKVTDIDGNVNYISTGYTGPAIPFYISNSRRGLKNKNAVIIYLSLCPELAQKLDRNSVWWQRPDFYTKYFTGKNE